jgi:hypothetical protein
MPLRLVAAEPRGADSKCLACGQSRGLPALKKALSSRPGEFCRGQRLQEDEYVEMRYIKCSHFQSQTPVRFCFQLGQNRRKVGAVMLHWTKAPLAGLLVVSALNLRGAPQVRQDSLPPGTASTEATPVAVRLDISEGVLAAAEANLLEVRALEHAGAALIAPAQFEPDAPRSLRGTLWWVMPPGCLEATNWVLRTRAAPSTASLLVQNDAATGQFTISEAGQRVLRYNYQTNAPGTVAAQVSADNQKYARARSDYIHPLYGFSGEELTKDWSLDHPHHRGIYWAWPEVDYKGERGDLHALQRVFARPTGQCMTQAGPVYAQIRAENLWLWEDREPIVREQARLRAWRGESNGRFIDLEFRLTALKDGVALARRETRLYGGLNFRLAAVQDQQIAFYTDPDHVVPRRAWADLSGLFPGGTSVSGLAIFQKPTNPEYPGNWIQYPDLNWFQPTFPSAGTRYSLKKGHALVLEYRLWLHSGRPDRIKLAGIWAAYADPPPVTCKLQPL